MWVTVEEVNGRSRTGEVVGGRKFGRDVSEGCECRLSASEEVTGGRE